MIVKPSAFKRMQSSFKQIIVAFAVRLEFESYLILGLQRSNDLFTIVKIEGPWFQKNEEKVWAFCQIYVFPSRMTAK